MKEKVIGVIPSRFASSRLLGKPLVNLEGKPMIQRVYEAAKRASSLEDVVVATDDARVAAACEKFAARVVMTSTDCPSGTDRIVDAIGSEKADIVVNVQGDEPLISPGVIDACVEAVRNDPDADVGSAMIRFPGIEEMTKPQFVKVVTDARGYAMYFSRAMIPDLSRLSVEERERVNPPGMKHLGLYVYRRRALDGFARLSQGRYEQLEKLEQLRFLENGFRIRMVEVEEESVGVDTPEDAERVRAILRGCGKD